MATSSSELKKDSGFSSNKSNDNDNTVPLDGRKQRRRTSSSTEKQNKTSSSSSTFPKESVVHRLAQAAARARKAAAAAADAITAAAAAATRDDKSIDKKTTSSNSELSSSSSSNIMDTIRNKDEMRENASPETPVLASLQALTRAVDERLRQNQQEASNMRRRRKKVHGDSMTAIIQHNQDISEEEDQQQQAAIMTNVGTTATTTTTTTNSNDDIHWGNNRRPPPSTTRRHDVAIVLSKPLQRDQLTVEHANRIRRLVRAMMPSEEEDDFDDDDDDELDENQSKARTVTRPYRPNVICFVGHSPGNLVADADAGYLYFQHLCAAQKVSVENIDIHLVRCSVEEGALKQIAFFLQETCVPVWIKSAATAAAETKTSSTTTTAATSTTTAASSSSPSPSSSLGTSSSLRFPKLHLHFTLVSSDYHLCQLHDLHICSPGRSPLRALETPQRNFRTTWSYLYVTTILPTRNHFQKMQQQQQEEDDSQKQVTRHYQKDASAAKAAAALFCAKTYKTTQELVPVLHNLRGVVDNREFFHTDSYQVLVSARRSLVSDMESLYREQPHLRAVHNLVVASHAGSAGGGDSSTITTGPLPWDGRPVDVVLEGALLYLGRCLDLVRPAGLFTGMVPKAEWNLARILLEQAIQQVTSVCDPDRPIDPSDWGSMGGNDDGSLVHAGSATQEEMTLLSNISIATSNEVKVQKSTKGKARKATKVKGK